MSTWNKTYHWKTKGVTPWSKQYFQDNLVDQDLVPSATGLPSGSKLTFSRVSSFEGDVELGNRKGKLITIYDVEMTLDWVLKGETDTLARGTLKFPELSHEVEDQGDEYTWESTLSSSDGSAEEVTKQLAYKIVKKELVEKVLEVIAKFRPTLIETHAKDLGHDSGTSTPTTTPAPAAASSTSTSSAAAAVKSSASKTTSSNVTVSSEPVELESRNACSQGDLWDLLTNQARIPMWTRAPAQFTPVKDSPFSLFNGNVTGTVQSATSPSEIIMAWRPPTWSPPSHHGTLTLTLSQEDDGTLLKIKLEGIPEGEEESSRKALEEFYLNGLRRLGLGNML